MVETCIQHSHSVDGTQIHSISAINNTICLVQCSNPRSREFLFDYICSFRPRHTHQKSYIMTRKVPTSHMHGTCSTLILFSFFLEGTLYHFQAQNFLSSWIMHPWHSQYYVNAATHDSSNSSPRTIMFPKECQIFSMSNQCTK